MSSQTQFPSPRSLDESELGCGLQRVTRTTLAAGPSFTHPLLQDLVGETQTASLKRARISGTCGRGLPRSTMWEQRWLCDQRRRGDPADLSQAGSRSTTVSTLEQSRG